MQTKSPCPKCLKVIDMALYEENRKMLFTKANTCAEHGTFSGIHWSDAALYRRFAECKDDGIGGGSLMPPDTWGQVHAGQ
jgi:uncharacterized radical SAM superfamily Fe-S cluster-containing enzyme